MRFVLAAASAALLLSGLSVQASAAVTPIAIGQNQDFKHKPSGLVIAASAGGLPRRSVGQIDQQQLDVLADFRTPDEREITTVYVFRNVSGSVPVWFDRAQFMMERSTALGSVAAAIPASAFTPAGRPQASGLRASYSVSGSPWKSSAVALTQVGEWYIKVRSSSQTLTPEELLARLDSTFAALRWPRERDRSAAIRPIADCPAPLPPLKPAKVAQVTAEDSMMAALLGGLAQQIVAKKDVKAKVGTIPAYCREPGASRPQYGIYRPDASARNYMIALADAGRAIFVGADELGALVGQGKAPMRYGVSYTDLDRAFTFAQFDSLPTFQQAVELVQTGKPISSSGTWGKNSRQISISPGN